MNHKSVIHYKYASARVALSAIFTSFTLSIFVTWHQLKDINTGIDKMYIGYANKRAISALEHIIFYKNDLCKVTYDTYRACKMHIWSWVYALRSNDDTCLGNVDISIFRFIDIWKSRPCLNISNCENMECLREYFYNVSPYFVCFAPR